MEALLPASLIFPGSEIHSSFLTPHPSRQYWTNLQNLPQLQWKLVNYHNQSVLCLRLQSTQPQCTFFVNAAELLQCFLDNIAYCFPCTKRDFFAKHIYVGPNNGQRYPSEKCWQIIIPQIFASSALFSSESLASVSLITFFLGNVKIFGWETIYVVRDTWVGVWGAIGGN